MPNKFGMHCITPVGRYFDQSVYVHKDFAHLIPHKIDLQVLEEAEKQLPTDFEYTLIRYDRNSGNISFIQVHNFDTDDDPIGGDSWYIKNPRYIAQGETHRFTSGKKDPQVYHHKWVYVPDDYSGFDFKRSRLWSERWRGYAYNGGFSTAQLCRLSTWNEFLKKHKIQP